MDPDANRGNAILRLICATAISVAALFFILALIGLGVEALQESEPNPHKSGLLLALGIVGLLAFFCVYISWRLWQGSLSSNGVTLMSTWFIRMFGIFLLILIGFVAYQKRSYLIFVSYSSLPLAMIFFAKSVTKSKNNLDKDSNKNIAPKTAPSRITPET